MVPCHDIRARLGKPGDLVEAAFHEYLVRQFPARVKFRVFCRFALEDDEDFGPRDVTLRIVARDDRDKVFLDRSETLRFSGEMQRPTWLPAVDFQVNGVESITLILESGPVELASWPVLVYMPLDEPLHEA